jgi:hypothetical protein
LALANLSAGTSHKMYLKPREYLCDHAYRRRKITVLSIPALIQEEHIVVSPLIALMKIKWMPFEVYLQKMGSLMY